MSTDSGRTTVHFENTRGRKREYIFAIDDKSIRTRARRTPLAGFPSEKKFANTQEVEAYFATRRLECLLCGRTFLNLGTHLKMHDMRPIEYCKRFNLPFSRGLTVKALKVQSSLSQRRRIERNPEWAAQIRGLHELSIPPKGRKPSWYMSQLRKESVSIVPRPCLQCGEMFSPHRLTPQTPKAGRCCSVKCRCLLEIAESNKRPCERCGVTLPNGSQNNGVKICKKCYAEVRKERAHNGV